MKAMTAASSKDHDRSGSAVEVLLAFAKLGVSCFGGPIAHIGYFRQEFVVRRRWLDEHAYADLVALCQFLPGPASSQVGFSLGLMRAGYLGGLAAWVGFTLPSAIALVLLPFLKLIAHQLIETRQRLELMKIRSAKERILLYN
jgi:chromate transporter